MAIMFNIEWFLIAIWCDADMVVVSDSYRI